VKGFFKDNWLVKGMQKAYIGNLTFLTSKMKEEIKEIRTVTITDKGQICIPNSIRGKEFKTGSKVSIIVYDNKIEIRPFKKFIEKMACALASEKTLAKDWNSKEDEKAWKNL